MTAATATQKYSCAITETTAGLRLDQAVAALTPGTSREAAKRLIAIGAVWLNGRRVKRVSTTVRVGDALTVYRSHAGCRRLYEINPANILYEDRHLLFYRKEPGVPSQGVPGDDYNNVAAALLRYCREKTADAYVGVHHRLDRDTSGVMLFTLSPQANRGIHEQFAQHRIVKTYLALVRGNPGFQETEITSFISRRDGRYCCTETGPGKTAVAVFTKLADYEGAALLRAQPRTGRTHQLRLQLARLGFPVLGDPLYGGSGMGCGRTMLHAESLTVIHPVSGGTLRIEAALFEDMLRLLR